jgi:putative tryptophan/tyrosine transport system substrate-binding protein
MRRREFIGGLGSASVFSIVAQAQQRATPVVGILSGTSPEGYTVQIAGLLRGLAETGYVEGRNLSLEWRWARDQYDRLPTLAADLVQRRVAVIIAIGSARSPLAARAATSTIPIVFELGSDPVDLGLVESLNRPGRNVTGSTTLGRELLRKRLEMLRGLVPGSASVGLLINPNNPNSEPSVIDLKALAHSKGWELHVVEASTEQDLERAFANLAQLHVGLLLHATDALFNSQGTRIAGLAERYSIPTIYTQREPVVAGGLMSYGADLGDQYREAGVYAGRILKGEKPANLPVLQPTKFELVINLKTAKALGLTVPETLLATADEVIQ